MFPDHASFLLVLFLAVADWCFCADFFCFYVLFLAQSSGFLHKFIVHTPQSLLLIGRIGFQIRSWRVRCHTAECLEKVESSVLTCLFDSTLLCF